MKNIYIILSIIIIMLFKVHISSVVKILAVQLSGKQGKGAE